MFSFIQITSEGEKSIDAIYHVNRKKGGRRGVPRTISVAEEGWAGGE